jgi:phosphatidylglycerol:prolipoprotein diacylglycerol transferase
MHPIIYPIGDVTLKPVVIWVMVIFALIFFSFAQSYGMAHNWKWGRITGLGIVFIIVGDAIIFFLYSALKLPRDYTIHNVNIYAYGLMLTIAFIVGTIITIRVAARDKISAEIVLDLVTFIIIGAIIGARLIYVVLKFSEYKENPASVMYITQGGLSVHGGILGGMVAAWIYAAYRKLNYWHLADIFAPQLALGLAIGRIGCFLNGCCYGVPTSDTNAWYAITFPENLHTGLTSSVPRHPAQLYEVFLSFLIFIYLRSFYKNRKFDGHAFLMWIGLYSIARFIQEFYRFNESSTVIFGFITIAQLASVILAVLAFVIIAEMKKRIELSKRIAEKEPEKAKPAIAKEEIKGADESKSGTQ